MKILIFGGSGQLGHELRLRANDLDFEVVSPVTKELNITERQQVVSLTAALAPDLVINCAAYTAVDKAESEVDQAYSVNRDGARNVAEAALKAKARVIHISTDYVFSGQLGRALHEDDQTDALSVYGKSKRAGELEVLSVAGDLATVVRTSSLHGQKGVNFVHTMIRLFTEQPVVKVVSDQYMSPTWAGWLAESLLDIGRKNFTGVLHASCCGAISWFDFAAQIKDFLKESGTSTKLAELEQTTASQLSRPAPRPRYSVFNTEKISELLGREPISWKEGLRNHLKDLGHKL